MMLAMVVGWGGMGAAAAAPDRPQLGWYISEKTPKGTEMALEFEVPIGGRFISVRGFIRNLGVPAIVRVNGIFDRATNDLLLQAATSGGTLGLFGGEYFPGQDVVQVQVPGGGPVLRPMKQAGPVTTTPTKPAGGGAAKGEWAWVRQEPVVISAGQKGRFPPEADAGWDHFMVTHTTPGGQVSNTVNWTALPTAVWAGGKVSIDLVCTNNSDGPMVKGQVELINDAVLAPGSPTGFQPVCNTFPFNLNQKCGWTIVQAPVKDAVGFTIRLRCDGEIGRPGYTGYSAPNHIGPMYIEWRYEAQMVSPGTSAGPASPPGGGGGGPVTPPMPPSLTAGTYIVVSGGPLQIRFADGSVRPGKAGDDIPFGATVEAGPGGRGVIMMPSGDIKLIAEKTRLRFAPPDAGPAVTLEAGSAQLLRPAKAVGSEVKIATPAGEVRVQGPELRMAHDEAREVTTVAAREGGVTLKPRNAGATVSVGEGQQVAMSASGVGAPQASTMPDLELPPLPRPPETPPSLEELLDAVTGGTTGGTTTPVTSVEVIALDALGCELALRGGKLCIAKVTPGSMAEHMELKAGDELVDISGTSVQGLSPDRVRALFGAAGGALLTFRQANGTIITTSLIIKK
jgi:hypothetical protein